MDFQGFPQPGTHLAIPAIILSYPLELLKKGIIKYSDIAVLNYIALRLYGGGYCKDKDGISLSQFLEGIITKDGSRLDHGCGIKSETTLLASLNRLEAAGLITRTQQKAVNGANLPTLYSLVFEASTLPTKTGEPPRTLPAKTGGSPSPKNNGKHRSPQKLGTHYVVVVNKLKQIGIRTTTANDLAQKFPEEHINEKLQMLADEQPPPKKPAAWLIKAIKEDWKPAKKQAVPESNGNKYLNGKYADEIEH